MDKNLQETRCKSVNISMIYNKNWDKKDLMWFCRGIIEKKIEEGLGGSFNCNLLNNK